MSRRGRPRRSPTTSSRRCAEWSTDIVVDDGGDLQGTSASHGIKATRSRCGGDAARSACELIEEPMGWPLDASPGPHAEVRSVVVAPPRWAWLPDRCRVGRLWRLFLRLKAIVGGRSRREAGDGGARHSCRWRATKRGHVAGAADEHDESDGERRTAARRLHPWHDGAGDSHHWRARSGHDSADHSTSRTASARRDADRLVERRGSWFRPHDRDHDGCRYRLATAVCRVRRARVPGSEQLARSSLRWRPP